MPTVAEIADRYVSEFAALSPIEASMIGIQGHDGAMTDYSPEASEQRAELARRTLRELDSLGDAADTVAGAVMRERVDATLAVHELGEHARALSVLDSPIGDVRQCFDLMATDTDEDWELIASRLEAVPESIASLRAALDAGRARGLVAARRQAIACAEQAATWGGLDAGTKPFFVALVDTYKPADGAMAKRLAGAARRATEAYADISHYLRDVYAPGASERDAVGADRYSVLARTYLGSEIDLVETYEWGWEELSRITTRMTEVGEAILSGATLPEVVAHIEGPDGPAVEGVENLKAWLQELLDSTIADMHGTHFDIPERVRVCEAMIAPPGGAAAQYYTPPSEDFSRPGRTWYPPMGKTRFPLWREVSTCYHEGVPGHHLQVAQVVHLAERLDRFQRLMAWTSGHGEGWALYAERLMDELGYLDEPAYELGMLSAQALRAARVIVDIGMHLELAIPASQSYHPGETWTGDLALPFLVERTLVEPEFLESEVDRYLGLPAQAISYKVGERVWLECRADARRRKGDDFDLKAFHSYALDLGNMGLDQLRTELAAF